MHINIAYIEKNLRKERRQIEWSNYHHGYFLADFVWFLSKHGILVSAWRMDNVFQCEDNGRPEYGVRQWDNVSNVEYGGIHLLSHYIKHVPECRSH